MSDLTDRGLVDGGAIPPDSFEDSISRTGEVAKHRLNVPIDIVARLEAEAIDLVISRETLIEAAAALIAGNLILQGPPGTGKSSLARALTRAFNVASLQATAREDWSVFDVIGGQELVVGEDNQEFLEPRHGWFTAAAIQCAGSVSRNLDDPEIHPEQATWLVIDELNRANMDRAFGELFSVLGTDELVAFPLTYMGGTTHKLTTSRRFRIIGTLNSIDKQFVNSLSLALRRRFTFITVDIPPQRAAEETWEIEPTSDSSLAILELDRVIGRAAKTVQYSGAADDLKLQIRPHLIRIMIEIEKVRYATENSAYPFLPIGTAPLIDTVELAIIASSMNGAMSWADAFDWACAVKLGPLFETDLESPEKLRAYADMLRPKFPRFARELSRIEAAGLYAVP
uniref:AAA family ATPase n=1 Tax=Cryobacterium sp. TaxID=1926290 RepID=UPI00159773F8|nr:AAA family ATPase [Cryobacterium sp.]QJS06290.1 ATPase family associated with various cellular activities (AAA) [Cryobacterium sp.]